MVVEDDTDDAIETVAPVWLDAAFAVPCSIISCTAEFDGGDAGVLVDCWGATLDGVTEGVDGGGTAITLEVPTVVL